MSTDPLSTTRPRPVVGATRAQAARTRLTAIDPARASLAALAALLVVAAALLWHETRGTTLWFDEWQWALDRRGNDPGTFLRPHNGHLSLIPIAIYRALFATAGLDHYGPYRALVIVSHLTCASLVFAYARRRVEAPLALAAATLVLFLGPAWQGILWPFQVGWLISLDAGLGALLLLDRRDRAGDLGASALLAVSLASSGIGVAVALGAAVDVLWGRRRRGDAWIVAAPLALYALWWLEYYQSQLSSGDLWVAPAFAADAAAAAVAAVTGLGGPATPGQAGTLLDWGRPLLLVALPALVWRFGRSRPNPARVLALATIAGTFWVLTALSRAYVAAPYASRYLYVGGLVVVLLAVEAARGIRLSPRAGAVVAVAVVAVTLSNTRSFRDGGSYLRGQAERTRADLAALDLGRDLVAPGFRSDLIAGLTAGSYFAAERSLGTPADSAVRLAAAPEDARLNADLELIRIHDVHPLPPAPGLPPARRPTIDAITAGTVTARGSCVTFTVAAYLPVTGAAGVQLTLRSPDVEVTTGEGATSVGVRRFADEFRTIGIVATHRHPGLLRLGTDRASQPWRLLISPARQATICGMG